MLSDMSTWRFKKEQTFSTWAWSTLNFSWLAVAKQKYKSKKADCVWKNKDWSREEQQDSTVAKQ